LQTYIPRPKERVLELIEAYILNNGLKSGDSLPPERELCAMWGVNRSTLRAALASLEDAGRIYSVQGSANRMSPRFRRTLQDLQGFSAYAKSCGLSVKTRLLSFSLVECDKHLANKFQRVLGEKLYKVSRLRILNDIPVLIETAFIPQELAPGLEEHDLVEGSLFDVLAEVYGLCMDHGTQKTSITYATEEEAALLCVSPGAPLYWIVSSTHSPDGTAIEYCRSVGRADSIEMESTLYWASAERRDAHE